jgi:hypothetical protein
VVSKRIVAVGGSDAGISAALRARELTPDSTVVVASAYPNFSWSLSAYENSGNRGHRNSRGHRLQDLAHPAQSVVVHREPDPRTATPWERARSAGTTGMESVLPPSPTWC